MRVLFIFRVVNNKNAVVRKRYKAITHEAIIVHLCKSMTSLFDIILLCL